MKEIIGVIILIISIILIVFSEEFRDILKIGTLLFIAHIVFEIYKVVK